jgi:hypothetical protein
MEQRLSQRTSAVQHLESGYLTLAASGSFRGRLSPIPSVAIDEEFSPEVCAMRKRIRLGVFALSLMTVLSWTAFPAAAQMSSARDGQRDFDFEIGKWKTHLKRLQHPLSGSSTWLEYEGTTVVTKVWKGNANLVELEVDGPDGHLEALSLRLYNPSSHQWSLNFANSRGGALTQPTIGEFKNGRGEFFDQEMLDGRAILVRFVISPVNRNSCHFEQAFSADGGKTWEVNWIADDTRVEDTPAALGEH